MNLNVNILLMIISYQCFTMCASELTTSTTQLNQSNLEEVKRKPLYSKYTVDYLTSLNRTDLNDCKLWVPFEDYNMPIPITANTSDPQLIIPNVNGNLIIKQNQYIKLACTNSHFVSPIFNRKVNEITVKCLNQTYLEYHNKPYKFKRFICNEIPRANLELSKVNCQNNSNYRILEVGFNTRGKIIKLYRICFDLQTRNPLYAWYNLQSPYSKRRQVSRFRPFFIKTKIYNDMNLNKFYGLQKKTVANILQSKYLSDYYIRHYDNAHFLSRGHLMARTEFNYAFQQSATFFYENTTPQWHVFNVGIWKDIEKLFKRNMAIGNSKHVIITGTYGVCTLPDVTGVERPLFLSLPNSISVPLYLWKIDYDLDKKNGVVFIGMNNPFKKVDNITYLCETITCPGSMIQQSKIVLLFYCCTLESFEKTYGKLDPIVYKWI